MQAISCKIQFSWKLTLWLSELAMRDWMNVGLNCQRQKWGQWTVISEHMRFVRIFSGVYCTGGDERSWAVKFGYYSHCAASSRRYLEMCGQLEYVLLADRTAIHSMIDYWHYHVVSPSVRLSVYLSATLYDVRCGSQGRCTGLKVVQPCSSQACWMFLFVRSDTFAVALSFIHKRHRINWWNWLQVVLHVNTHRLTETDFWYGVTLSRWQPWSPPAACCCICSSIQKCPPATR